MDSVGLCQLGSTRIAVIAKSSKLKLSHLVIGLGESSINGFVSGKPHLFLQSLDGSNLPWNTFI